MATSPVRALSVSWGLALLVTLLPGPGCRCRGAESDGGADGSIMLQSTNTIVAVTSSVAGIEQLHVRITLEDAFGMDPCQYLGNTYEGYIPAITTGAALDLACPMDPFNCPTFHINWAGDETSSSLGGIRFSGIGDITCTVALDVDGLGAGMVVLANGNTTDAFAVYGVNNGPRSVLHLDP